MCVCVNVLTRLFQDASWCVVARYLLFSLFCIHGYVFVLSLYCVSLHIAPPNAHTCTYTHTQVVAVLLRSGQFSQSFLQRSDMPHTALLLAAKSGHNEVIGLLVKHGFDINRKLPGANGNCLHEAALYGKVETVKYLLQVCAYMHT